MIDLNVAGFDWDEGNRGKCLNHGVPIAEIEGLFRSTVMILPDAAHSTDNEERHLAIGRTAAGRHVLLAFALRDRGGKIFIRPIGARYIHRKEVDHYENENPRPGDR